MQKPDKIFLIGFMGSGKTTTGKKLASRLSWKFIDLDEFIEEDKGMPVAEIFETQGEDWFRTVEAEALRTVAKADNTVISTGGGTPCFYENMEFMLQNGLTVYLRMTPESLARRLARSSAGRPLLKDIDKEELETYIRTKLAEREPWYSMAEIKTDIAERNFFHLLSLIKKRLGR
ncbi:MAG TPA: shikimate kinase [Bacteroidales bacterium]|nr:shikimate kinase [Bacteroidales bacterium]